MERKNEASKLIVSNVQVDDDTDDDDNAAAADDDDNADDDDEDVRARVTKGPILWQ